MAWCRTGEKPLPELMRTHFNDAYMCHLASMSLTHWGRVTHICVTKIISIGSDNGLSPVRRQAIIWTNAGILLIWPLGTIFSEILIEIHIFSFKKMGMKILSARWRPFCLGLNVFKHSFTSSLSWLQISTTIFLSDICQSQASVIDCYAASPIHNTPIGKLYVLCIWYDTRQNRYRQH